VETGGTASICLVNEEYEHEYKKLVNDRDITADYVPEPYKSALGYFVTNAEMNMH